MNTPNLPNGEAQPGLPPMCSEHVHQPTIGQNLLVANAQHPKKRVSYYILLAQEKSQIRSFYGMCRFYCFNTVVKLKIHESHHCKSGIACNNKLIHAVNSLKSQGLVDKIGGSLQKVEYKNKNVTVMDGKQKT